MVSISDNENSVSTCVCLSLCVLSRDLGAPVAGSPRQVRGVSDQGLGAALRL